MSAQILINEQHLGSEATESETLEMIRILNERGYDVAYGDKIASEDDENANAIPDDVWTECLDEAIAAAAKMTFASQLQTAKGDLTARQVAAAVSPLLSVRTVEDWLADRRSPHAWTQEWILSRVRSPKKARSCKG